MDDIDDMTADLIMELAERTAAAVRALLDGVAPAIALTNLSTDIANLGGTASLF